MQSNIFRCPRCSSYNTQTFEAAYLQHARHGTNASNEIAHLVAPPPIRSTLYVPGAVGALTSYLITLLTPMVLFHLEIPSSGIVVSPLDPMALAIGFITGGIAFYLLRAKAQRYNITILQDQLEVWKRQLICRRCSYLFELPEEEIAS